MKIADAIDEARRAANELAALDLDPDADETAWHDTLSGMTDALDVAEWLIRKARERDALADSAAAMIEKLTTRKARFSAARDRLRAAAGTIMEAAGVKKMERADFTASLRQTPARAIELDREATPKPFRRDAWTPDKDAIRKTLLAGGEVDGWTLGNGGTALTVRST